MPTKMELVENSYLLWEQAPEDTGPVWASLEYT